MEITIGKTQRHTLVCQYNISLLISFFFFFISGTSFSVSSIVQRLPSLLPPHLGPSTERLNALQIEQENGIIYNMSTLLRGSPRDWVDPIILARITVFRGKGEGISRCNKNIGGGGEKLQKIDFHLGRNVSILHILRGIR